MTLLGAGLDRVDGRLKVTGEALYVGDMTVPHMAHAVLILSSIACGDITTIDQIDALRMPGVLAVMTHLDAPKLPNGGRDGVDPPAGRVLSLLQDGVVHYNRQPIGIVVAETLDEAIAAASHVNVSYRQSSAQLQFSEARDHAHAPAKANREATDSARGSFVSSSLAPVAAASITATYSTPMEHHNPLEPHATLAQWQGDQLTLYDTTQFISGCRTTIAKVLGLSRENVRVLCPFVGGGFGSKGSTWSHVALVAMVARRVNRPVKLVLQRPQMFGPVGGRPQTEQRLYASAGADGHLIALQHDSFSHTSRLEDFTEPAALQTRIMYACPNVKTSHRLVKLDVATPTFQRAPGHATGTFALESALDELAYKLQLDPIELRLRNEPAQDPDKNVPWSSRSIKQCYIDGARAFGWSQRTAAPCSMRHGRDLTGLGFATATYPANRSAAEASARLTADGVLVVQCGTHDLGTGTYTVMSQIAADFFDIPMEKVRFELGDSRFPEAPVSGGSQSAASVAPAVHAASTALREKLVALAIADKGSPVFAAAATDVVLKGGKLGLRMPGSGALSRSESLGALVTRYGQEIVAAAGAKPGDEQHRYSMHSFGAVFVEVRIDPDLHVIRVPRVVARYSVGRLLNSKTGRSQLLGGVVWGLSMALLEDSVLDTRNGRIVNANLAEYYVPTQADIGSIDVDVVDENDPFINDFGARGIGEIGITGVAAALANAIYHATGKRMRELPITLDKLMG